MSNIVVTRPHSRNESYFEAKSVENVRQEFFKRVNQSLRNRLTFLTIVSIFLGVFQPIMIPSTYNIGTNILLVTYLFTLLSLYVYFLDYSSGKLKQILTTLSIVWLVVFVIDILWQSFGFYRESAIVRIIIPLLIARLLMTCSDYNEAWSQFKIEKQWLAKQVDQKWSLIRRDHLIHLESPFVSAITPINKLQQGIYSIISIKNPFNIVRQSINPILNSRNSLALYSFIVIFITCFISLRGNSSLIETAIISITTAVIATVMMVAISYLFNNSRRYIVIPFEVVNGEKQSPELRAIATLMTENLVVELQKIAMLLHVRQVENLNLEEEGNNAFFVTSSTDAEFFDQLNNAVNLELPSTGSVSLGTFLHMIYRFIAKIRIYGKIQRRTNGSIEIQANLSYSSNSNATVNQVIIPERFISEIDITSTQPIARNLAIKLLLGLGFITHLGTTHSSLDQMLQGLEASVNRNWWLAISHYKQAIQEEESLNHKFGIGYFHLGTALLFLGHWQDGMEHLRTAERDGPLIPELQYMMALALLFIHWGELHKKENVFDEIISRLKSAETLRPTFPEATHLRGVTYYRRGRLRERWDTKWYQSPEPNKELDKSSVEYKGDFKQSQTQYQKAYQIYDKILRKTNPATNNNRITHNQKSSQVQQHLTLSHLIADSLRVQNQYEKAIQYYYESLNVHPDNLRTMADMAKTYCLDGNWKEAEEFLWRQAFKDDIAYWNADICIHMGWALAGGIQANKHKKKEKRYKILLESMQFLDYSIHQRPRYITYYSQTEWFTPFNRATQQRTETPDDKTMEEFLYERFQYNDNDNDKIKQLQLWLAYRIDTFCLFSKPDKGTESEGLYIDCKWKKDANLISNVLEKQGKYRGYGKYYLLFKKQREHIIDFLNTIQNSKRNQGIYRSSQRLKHARKLYRLWKRASTSWHNEVNIDKLINTEKKELELSEQFKNQGPFPLSKEHVEEFQKLLPNLLDRIVIDILLEITLLTAKMLAESKAYELLFEVAEVGCQISTLWVQWWQTSYKNTHFYNPEENFIFNARVFRYQQASIYGWHAYATYFCREDSLSESRIQSEKKEYASDNHGSNIRENLRKILSLNKHEWLEYIQSDINAARQHIFHHPLIMYMEALTLRKRGMADQAIVTYENLIDLIAPYDPKQALGADTFGDYAPDKPTPNVFTHKRTYLRFMEQVSGRQQFYTLIDKSRIHMEIADTYAELDKPHLRVEHLREAIRWSPHDDQDIDNLIRLANQLNNIERYKEASAVVDAIQRPAQRLGLSQPSHTKRRTPQMLKCIIDTRSANYSVAMNNAKSLASNFALHSTIQFVSPDNGENHETLKDRLKDISKTTQSVMGTYVTISDSESQDPFSEHRGDFNSLYDNITQKTLNMFDIKMNQIEDAEQSQNQQEEDVTSNTHLIKVLLSVAGHSKHQHPLFNNKKTIAEQILKVFKNVIHIENGKIQLLDVENRMRESQFSSNKTIRSILLDNLWDVLSSESKNEIDKYFDFILASQIMHFLSVEASKSLSQLSELCNVLAYCRAQTGLHLPHAFLDSACSVAINAYLMNSFEQNTRPRKALAKKMAQFCDTFGWVRFRYGMNLENPKFFVKDTQQIQNNDVEQTGKLKQPAPIATKTNRLPYHIDSISIAEEFFRMAIRYDQERSIMYYHLARIYLAKLEMLWQLYPEIIQTPDSLNNSEGENVFAYIDAYLIQVLQQHRFAKKYDKFGRLHIQLAWVYNIIMSYKRAWENRKYRGFAGDDKMNMYETIGIISQD